jgi:hypothetical protein
MYPNRSQHEEDFFFCFAQGTRRGQQEGKAHLTTFSVKNKNKKTKIKKVVT